MGSCIEKQEEYHLSQSIDRFSHGGYLSVPEPDASANGSNGVSDIRIWRLDKS